jgi:hypothetical protein
VGPGFVLSQNSQVGGSMNVVVNFHIRQGIFSRARELPKDFSPEFLFGTVLWFY